MPAPSGNMSPPPRTPTCNIMQQFQILIHSGVFVTLQIIFLLGPSRCLYRLTKLFRHIQLSDLCSAWVEYLHITCKIYRDIFYIYIYTYNQNHLSLHGAGPGPGPGRVGIHTPRDIVLKLGHRPQVGTSPRTYIITTWDIVLKLARPARQLEVDLLGIH